MNVTVAILFLLLGTGKAQDQKLIEFELEDQFEQRYTHEDFLGNIVILIGSDKGGSSFNAGWAAAIADSLRDKKNRVGWLPVSDLSSVPFFLKGFVRSKFPDDPEQWVLLDWSGDFAEAYQFEEGASNVLVFDRQGRLLRHASGREINPAKIQAIVAAILPLVN